MPRSPVARPKSDHNLIAADIRPLGRFYFNRRKRETMGRRAVAPQQPMATPQTSVSLFIDSLAPPPPGTDAVGMAAAHYDRGNAVHCFGRTMVVTDEGPQLTN